MKEIRIEKKRPSDWFREYFLYYKGVGYSVLKNAGIIDGYSLDDWRKIVADFEYVYNDYEPVLSRFWYGLGLKPTSKRIGVYGVPLDVWGKLNEIFSDIRASVVTLCACHKINKDADVLPECLGVNLNDMTPLDVNLNDMTPQDVYCLSCYADDIKFGKAIDYKDRVQFQRDLFLGNPKDASVRTCYVKRFEQTKQLINVMKLKECYGTDLIVLSSILVKGTEIEISRFDKTNILRSRAK